MDNRVVNAGTLVAANWFLGWLLPRPKPRQHNFGRGQQNINIQIDRRMLNVVEVVLDFVLGVGGAGGVALAYLGPAGDAGFYCVAVGVEG